MLIFDAHQNLRGEQRVFRLRTFSLEILDLGSCHYIFWLAIHTYSVPYSCLKKPRPDRHNLELMAGPAEASALVERPGSRTAGKGSINV